MQREIQIDLLDVDVWSLIRDKSPPPLGITIDGPRGRSLNSEGAGGVPMFLLMTITLPVATNLVASYLFQYLSKHRAKRIRIDREEITCNQGEVERIMREKIDIQH